MTAVFRRFAELVAYAAGTPWAFIGALAILITWGIVGRFLASPNIGS